MRMIKWAMVALTTVLFASASWATPLAASSGYWEITYDISNSTMDVTTVLGVTTVQLGPGGMVLQHQKPIFGGDSRLAVFSLAENFNVLGVVSDRQITMLGDANGRLNTGNATVEWYDGAQGLADGWNDQGTIECTSGPAICDIIGLPENVLIPVNSTTSQPIGDWQLTASGGNMSWIVAPSDPSAPQQLNIVGTSTTKVWIAGIPEPTTSLLVGLGLLGLAAARSRRS
jgi:hypothetical protein